MTAIVGLLTSTEFLAGAGIGLIGLGLLYALPVRFADWGIVWGAAVIGALASTGWLIIEEVNPARRGPPASPTMVTVAALVAGIAAFGIWRLRTNWIGAPAVAISIAGIWATVPDTERLAVLMGVTAVLIWAWWPANWAAPNAAGALAVGLITAWLVTRGEIGRETGWIGAVGSLSMLGVSAFGLPRHHNGLWLAGHFALVLVWSRWAGLLDSNTTAILTGVLATLGVVVISHLLSRESEPAPRIG